jgi:F0F1-type ATP synthase membrane subunit c/vacuolar-type H+-ATPase subunit K
MILQLGPDPSIAGYFQSSLSALIAASMEASLRMLNIVKMAMLASIALYAIMAERMSPPMNHVADRFFFAIAGMAFFATATCFVLRRVLVSPPEETLQREPENPAALQRWRAGHIVLMTISESVALFGFVLRFQGATLIRVAPFYVVGALLLLAPRPP